ncbi:HGE-14 family type IV secretion system effector [Anaplasma phagocytophilum]|uniref:HGE-14 family type IV secretion system effector n=1 Tax=Anaplasma phagocytophilum TaxID=948 RepID=UPI002010951E|nr:hypothetical protein [Anaplasma phagocytophilum]UQD53984.1 hypothetical protein ESP60_00565 [Anaplasma phagocytophilum]
MHMPRIFTTPVMSGYAYSGLSSTEYKDSLCRAITYGLMSYDEFLKVLREFMLELRSTLNELQGVDAVFAANVDKINLIVSHIGAESVASAGPTGRDQVLRGLTYNLCDVLQDCATAACNQDVARFIDQGFIRRRAHLQIAKVCSILVNALVMVHCCARTFSMSFASDMGERDAGIVYHASMALSAYVNAKFSGLSICLNSSVSTEEKERRKAILRMVRHNIELCYVVAGLLSPHMSSCFRQRTEACLNSIIDAVETSAAACEAMVRNNESAKLRLDTAGRARSCFAYYFKIYYRCYNTRWYETRWYKQGKYTRALVHTVGSLFSIYRGYASTGNADHVVAGKFDHCLRILLALHRIRGCITVCMVRKIYLDMCTVYDEIQECVTRGLLLNPQAEVGFCNAMLGHLLAMIGIWEKKYGGYFNNTRQTDGSLSQPSTSGLGSTSVGVGGQHATSVPLRVLERIPIPYDAPWNQPSTSGLGSTSVGVGRAQAPYIPPHDPGMMPYSYAQPSTSGSEGTSAGTVASQASLPSNIPARVLESVPYPSSQPSTSGLGGAVLEEASVAPCQQQMPDDDAHKQPSKRARYR